MAIQTFLYRRGDGNEGNFPRYMLAIDCDQESAYDALRAMVANDYIAGKRVRRHIMANIEVDGDTECGLSAMVYEGPEGEQAFGAAWLTAALEPLSAEDVAFYADRATPAYTLKQVLDGAAWRYYRALRRGH